jgi:hypothetical protein
MDTRCLLVANFLTISALQDENSDRANYFQWPSEGVNQPPPPPWTTLLAADPSRRKTPAATCSFSIWAPQLRFSRPFARAAAQTADQTAEGGLSIGFVLPDWNQHFLTLF